MPLDTAEGIADAFLALGIGQNIIAAVQALPPKETRKAVDYGKVLGFAAGSTGEKILQLVDQVEADIAD